MKQCCILHCITAAAAAAALILVGSEADGKNQGPIPLQAQYQISTTGKKVDKSAAA